MEEDIMLGKCRNKVEVIKENPSSLFLYTSMLQTLNTDTNRNRTNFSPRKPNKLRGI